MSHQNCAVLGPSSGFCGTTVSTRVKLYTGQVQRVLDGNLTIAKTTLTGFQQLSIEDQLQVASSLGVSLQEVTQKLVMASNGITPVSTTTATMPLPATSSAQVNASSASGNQMSAPTSTSTGGSQLPGINFGTIAIIGLGLWLLSGR